LRLSLSSRAFAFFDVDRSDWYVEPGTFEILVAASVEDVRLIGAVHLTNPETRLAPGGAGAPRSYLTLDDVGLQALGLQVPPADGRTPYCANSTINEMVAMNCLLKRMYDGVLWMVGQVARHTSLAEKAAGGMGDVETLVRMIRVGTGMMNPRGVQLMSGGSVTPRQVDAAVDALNCRWCTAIARLCGCIGHKEAGLPPAQPKAKDHQLVSPLL